MAIFKQISFLLLSGFKRSNKLLSPENYQKNVGFLMISGGIEVSSLKFAQH